MIRSRAGAASSDAEITGIATADAVASTAERIYGRRLEPAAAGLHVLHPTAVWRRGDGALVTLKINEWSPTSVHDFFVLNLARARADAIIVSGKSVRGEPDLSHRLQGPERVPDALRAWRERLGKSAAPTSLVLTSGRGLDFSHPLFHGESTAIVFTSPSGAERLRGRRAAGVEIVSVERPDLRQAISFLYEERHAETISIETGPSTSVSLYEPPVRVCELLLSVYEAPALDERVRGGAFVDPERIDALFERPAPPYQVEAASGARWIFSRYLRPGSGP